MNDKKSNKVHERVIAALGMATPEPEPKVAEAPAIDLPPANKIVKVDNAELPQLSAELNRLEHCQQQTEFLLNHGLPAVQQSLSELTLMPPMYKGRAMEASAELFKAVADLLKHKAELQLEMMQMRMKMASFIRAKAAGNNVTGNTFIFNREELIRAYSDFPSDNDGDENTEQGWDK